ncbi:MAG: hypothetical protein COS71_03010 [Candidatus Moranbacteria bacterium CG06_land_8_20_14_3_00_40_12]|nr:MAG: hypothetical protein COS71_03010 [Candidatus Moranbacteria bacterium CG06_land_8_20_14_3_00_40_12]
MKVFIRRYGRTGEKGAHEEIIISESERASWVENSYFLVENKTRFVLDTLEKLPTFKVVSNPVYARMQSEEAEKAKTYKCNVEINNLREKNPDSASCISQSVTL